MPWAASSFTLTHVRGGEADRRRRRPGVVAVKHLAADGVELGSGHAPHGRGEHRVAGLGDDATRQLQPGEVLVLVDRHERREYRPLDRSVAKRWGVLVAPG